MNSSFAFGYGSDGYFKDFNNLVIFILQNLLSLKNESKLSGKYNIKFFLIEENFNHQKKFFYFNLVLNTMEVKDNGDTIFKPGLARNSRVHITAIVTHRIQKWCSFSSRPGGQPRR